MENLSIFLVFLAGIASFLSPCILPLVPVYVGDLSSSLTPAGASMADRQRTLFKTLSFVAGFSLVFILLGAAAGAMGSFIVRYQWLWNKVAGVMLVGFGLHLLGAFRAIPFLYYEKRLFQPRPGLTGPLRSFMMGAAFSSGWSPCVGPVLGGVLALAVTTQTAATGAALMAIFSLGLALPFLAIGLGLGKAIGLVRKMGKFLGAVNIITGVLVIIIGLIVFFDASYLINAVLRQYFPVN